MALTIFGRVPAIHMGATAFALATTASSSPVLAQSNTEVGYGPQPAWVVPPPETDGAPDGDNAFSLDYRDIQVHLDEDGTHQFETYRIKILHAQALPLGNINVAWQPDFGALTVHRLQIHRGDETIDVLADEKFSIFQREGGLEQSRLDGILTANLNIPGLRVGDEIEFAATIDTYSEAFDGRDTGSLLFLPGKSQGTIRMRIGWDKGHEPKLNITPPMEPYLQRGNRFVQALVTDLPARPLPSDSAYDMTQLRVIEYGDFTGWRDVSRITFPLFEDAARLSDGSPIKAEAAKIAGRHSSQRDRAREALRLVQDDVRYIYVGLNGGNFIPATAEETWERRYGDCKGKTVLLMALLDEMGIENEAVLVNSSGGLSLQRGLPMPGQFDHVLVRAKVDGEWVWMDGTRHGDLRLATTSTSLFGGVLPLTAQGEDLEMLPVTYPEVPQELEMWDIDASAGSDKPARMQWTRVFRGDDGLEWRALLMSAPKAQVRDQFTQSLLQEGWETVENVDWSFTDDGSTTLLVEGDVELDWEGSPGSRDWTVYGGGFYPPDEMKRPAEQDQDAPYWNKPTSYSCRVVTVQLPDAADGSRWTHNASMMDDVFGGVAYWRQVEIDGGTFRMVSGSRTLEAQVPASTADTVNAQIEDFDNRKVVLQEKRDYGTPNPSQAADYPVPAAQDIDWTAPDAPCSAPEFR